MQISQLSIFAFVGSILFATAGGAASSCTDWMDQGDGTSWTTCVDDNGVQHCYKIAPSPETDVRNTPERGPGAPWYASSLLAIGVSALTWKPV